MRKNAEINQDMTEEMSTEEIEENIEESMIEHSIIVITMIKKDRKLIVINKEDVLFLIILARSRDHSRSRKKHSSS